MVQQARSQLGLINPAAAAENDLTHVFESRADFPDVFERHAELRDADQAVHDLLPRLASQLGLPKLAYTSVQNQVWPLPSCTALQAGTLHAATVAADAAREARSSVTAQLWRPHRSSRRQPSLELRCGRDLRRGTT